MLKPSNIINAALVENARQREEGGDPARLRQLQAEWGELSGALGQALATEAAADRAVAVAGFRAIAVTTEWPDPLSMADATAARFTIEWQAPTWNYGTDALEWAALSVSGFASVPADVRAHMLETCPEVLPDIIADLAPNDPAAALATHLATARRTFN